MFETTSVFDAMELDHTQQRLAARNALALAHIRVENALGAFLSSSVGSDEFEARLASVKPEMEAYVSSACEECGHDKPEHITASLIDNYRVNRRWQPRVAYPQYPEPMGAQPAGQPIDPAIAQQQEDPAMQMPQGQPQAPVAPGMEHMQQPQMPGMGEMPMVPGQMPGQLPVAHPGDLQGVFSSEGKQGATNPSDQKSDVNKEVTCPACGGNGKTANQSECPKCHGKGKVGNFGDSVLDKVTHVPEHRVRRWTPVVAAGNTDLGGPEPKMDKAEWTRSNPGMPDDDSKQFPVEHKDPLVPIIMTNRDQDGHDLKEIGEQTTEHKDLPAAQPTDHGFYDGGEEHGPHTKTFGDGKHVDPVTKATQPE